MADELMTTEYDEAIDTDIETFEGDVESEGLNPGLLIAIGAGAALAIREGAGFIWRKTADWREGLKEKAAAKKAEKEAKKADKEEEVEETEEEPKEEAPKKTKKK